MWLDAPLIYSSQTHQKHQLHDLVLFITHYNKTYNNIGEIKTQIRKGVGLYVNAK